MGLNTKKVRQTMSNIIDIPKKKPLKIAVAVPSGDLIHADFAMSLIFLVANAMSKGINVAMISQKGPIIEISRNELVLAAKKINADKIFFVDSDMTFPADTLSALLDTKTDIVCCDAVRRRPPYTSVVNDIEGNPIDHATCKKDMVEIDGVSTACLLIDMKVFDKMKMPFFHVDWKDDDTFVGEDYYFSRKAIENGYKVWCNVKQSQFIGHIGLQSFFVDRKTDEKAPKA